MATACESPRSTTQASWAPLLSPPRGSTCRNGCQGCSCQGHLHPLQAKLCTSARLGQCQTFWWPRHFLWWGWWRRWSPEEPPAWTSGQCDAGTGRPVARKSSVSTQPDVCIVKAALTFRYTRNADIVKYLRVLSGIHQCFASPWLVSQMWNSSGFSHRVLFVVFGLAELLRWLAVWNPLLGSPCWNFYPTSTSLQRKFDVN